MGNKIRAGIVGFTGYSGAELVKILERHSGASPVLLEHRTQTEDEKQFLNGHLERMPWDDETLRNGGLSMVFFATPHEVSLELVPKALDAGIEVVDLSGAFRLRTADNYERWYRMAHDRPDLLTEAAYGLPEYFRNVTKTARLVSNPGCYPTAANFALRPLVTEGILDRGAGVICDAKSGVSGAGKKPTGKTHFSSVTENFSAYAVLTHRHVPEVLLTSGLEEHELSFTAQLLPVHRGILETIYVRTTESLGYDEIAAIYGKTYKDEPFVRIFPEGQLPDLQTVNYTNFCDIGIKADPATKRVVIVAAIDNLVKGAAGQAVQNMNLMLGVPETEALL
jgi:N-acetyl-gamma-glutamyl-phosphate reductase